MSSVIQNLLDNTLGDGARSSKFECLVQIAPPGLFDASEIVVLTKTSQFPGKSHEQIDFKFKGRTIPIKGQTKYDNTWTCVFYLTQDHLLKKAFEDWIESLDQQHNYKEPNSKIKSAQLNNNVNGYTSDMKIAQLNFDGDQETVIYELYNVFPKSVSAVDVDYSGVGTILEFTVEFSYSHYDVQIEKTDLGTFVDEIKSKAEGAISNVVGSVQKQITTILKRNTNSLLDSLNSIRSESNPFTEMLSKIE